MAPTRRPFYCRTPCIFLTLVLYPTGHGFSKRNLKQTYKLQIAVVCRMVVSSFTFLFFCDTINRNGPLHGKHFLQTQPYQIQTEDVRL
jgi:hypothetical protein